MIVLRVEGWVRLQDDVRPDHVFADDGCGVTVVGSPNIAR
jgi:hypothetical protein